MNTITLDRSGTSQTPVRRSAKHLIADDRAMLRVAAELTRDLRQPKAWLYWTDMAGSALLGYSALAVAMAASGTGLLIGAGIVATLALYRALLFIHEVSHMKHAALPGFRTGFNALVGVPLLTPSFMYEGVHNLHHAKTRYGTIDDPEYLPLALMKPWTLPVFIVVSTLAPFALLFRYAILSPGSLLAPRLRSLVVERYSALTINPSFRRRSPDGDARLTWHRVEVLASLWAWTIIALVVSGTMAFRSAGIAFVVVSAVAVLNQVRTLVAHLWENEGEAMTVTAQYLDSVNVPPPALLPGLWAPVGLRYHALHHLLPSLPYHALAEAHRRISAALDPESPYHKASYKGATGLMAQIGRSTMARRG